MLLLDSLYINNSGGKVLLDQLIRALYESGQPVFYLIDKRCEGDYPFLEANKVIYLEVTLERRKQFYIKEGNRFSKVLCFGNIPPPIRLKALVYTYFHQLLYLETPPGTPLKKRLMTWLKSSWIKRKKINTDYWIVQTAYGKGLLAKMYNVPSDRVLEYPFYREITIEGSEVKRVANRFLYVSDGNPHKNHVRLLQAWKIVQAVEKEWELHLTISNAYPALQQQVEEMKKYGHRIDNHGRLNRKELSDLYRSATWFVFPSYTESLGLPLVEAVNSGCIVIGSDRDYLKSVVSPGMVFDPDSVSSIAEVLLQSNTSHKRSMVLIENKLDALVKILGTQ